LRAALPFFFCRRAVAMAHPYSAGRVDCNRWEEARARRGSGTPPRSRSSSPT
jgi:hypothetical protein